MRELTCADPEGREGAPEKLHKLLKYWAATCDFQQCGILIWNIDWVFIVCLFLCVRIYYTHANKKEGHLNFV